jgi:hypothetical protein
MRVTRRYSSVMPTHEVQAHILRVLQGKPAITMADLVDEIRRETKQPPVSIRAAILPLISIRQVEFTRDRKLRLRAEMVTD